jgi:hypothetical protein
LPGFPTRTDLAALAKRLGRKFDAVIALTDGNDPWFAEIDYRQAGANWFRDIFATLAISTKFHARRIFYALISQKPPVVQPNGTPFENNNACAVFLSHAIRDARYLDLISTDIVEDRKNPPPILNLADNEEDSTAEVSVTEGEVQTTAFGMFYAPPAYTLPSLSYSAPTIGQRYHVEIWAEKSTMNDILLPLGTEYGINVVTFGGESSATACKDLVIRAIESGKPVRILHVTDFDPAGHDTMPVAAAVKIDFFAKKSGHDLDIRFEHVVLTPEQCAEYDLPRTPIKETEKRAKKFEARYGRGATELDALEALHPGALREILIGHIERFYDAELESNLAEAEEDFASEIDDAEEGVIQHYREEQIPALDSRIADIQRIYDEVHQPARAAYNAAVDPARDAYDEAVRQAAMIRDSAIARAREAYYAAIEPVREQIETMEQEVVETAQTLVRNMADDMEEAAQETTVAFDWPEPAEGDEDEDALYISARDYIDQVDRFREHQGQGRGRRQACQD